MIVTINSEYLDIINGKNCKNGNKAVFERLRHNISTVSNINAAISENKEQKDDHIKIEENMQPQMMIEAVQECDASEVDQLHTVVNEKIAGENNVKTDVRTDENTFTKKDTNNNANNILVKTQNEINDVYIGSIIADCVVITNKGDNERKFDVVEKTEKQESVSVYVQNNEPVIEESFNSNVIVVQKEKTGASVDPFIADCVVITNEGDNDIGRKCDKVDKIENQESANTLMENNEAKTESIKVSTVYIKNEKKDMSSGSFFANCAPISTDSDNKRNCDVTDKTVQQESYKCSVQSNEAKTESFVVSVVDVKKEKIDASVGSYIADCLSITNESDKQKKCDVVEKTVQQEAVKVLVQSNEKIRDENLSEHYKKIMADRIHAAQHKEAHCPKDYVEYLSLSEEEKMKLAVFCCKKIRAMRKKGWIKKTIGWVRNVFSPKKDSYYCGKKVVNKSFYNLQDLILKDAKNKNKIFRKSFDDSNAEEILNSMLSAQPCNFDGYSTYDLVGMYKWYIRNVLNGLLPESITKALLEVGAKNIFKQDNYEQYKDVIKYLVFAIPEEHKRILKSIFAIFESVENNYNITEMDIKSLIICIAPSIFDSKFFKKIEHAKLAVEITGIQYHCDYDKIDKALYDEFCLYNKNK
ncbi:Dynein light chain Tctex-type [Binucleata daphniae]